MPAELGNLELELEAVNSQIKAEDAQKLQLYTQAKSLDNKIVTLAKKQKPLERALEVGNKGLSEVEASWISMFHKFHEAQLPPSSSSHIILLLCLLTYNST